MTNKELQAILSRFPEDAIVVFPTISLKDHLVYSLLTDEDVKLRRLTVDKTGEWFTYSKNSKETVLSIGDRI